MFGNFSHNVDMRNLDSQQRYIYNKAWNEAIEACFKEIAKRGPISQDAFEAVQRLRK